MRRHLREVRQSHIEAEVIAELGRVREELGWPIVMTPFAQMILTLAVMNVTGKERYATIPDEVIRYAVGRFGRPNIPIDGAVMDRIMSLPRTNEILAETGMAPLPELRRRIGVQLSDEEFLLRATMPAGLVDAMQAAGPANREYKPYTRPVLELIRGLCRQRGRGEVLVQKPGFRLGLRS
jgi:oxaloacetate decarboxylase alpha subunit